MRKIKSRKFFVFLCWIPLMAGILFKPSDSIIAALPWFGGISMVYVGFQAIVDFIPSILEVIKAWKGTEKEEDE